MTLVQGTLDMLILKTLALEPLHSYGIGVRIAQISQGVCEVGPGSLFPALRRLERSGRLSTKWRITENNRRAKYYSLTAAGRKQLVEEEEEWRRTSVIVNRFLNPAESKP
jgi:transcriptional regulator